MTEPTILDMPGDPDEDDDLEVPTTPVPAEEEGDTE